MINLKILLGLTAIGEKRKTSLDFPVAAISIHKLISKVIVVNVLWYLTACLNVNTYLFRHHPTTLLTLGID